MSKSDFCGTITGVITCKHEGCAKPVRTRGFCGAHYSQWRRSLDPGYRARQTAAQNARYRNDPEYAQRCRDHQARRYQTDDAYATKVKAYGRLRHTGFSPEVFQAAWISQRGGCAVCTVALCGGVTDSASVHADHYETLNGARVPQKTPKSVKHPRGLLCKACNTALGWYETAQYPAGLRIPAYDDYLARTTHVRLP